MTKAPSEKHLEDWIVANPDRFALTYGGYEFFRIHEILARQYRVPSGIMDILAVDTHGCLMGIELKMGGIDNHAYTQAMKYRADLADLWSEVQNSLGVAMHSMKIMTDVHNASPQEAFCVVLIGSHIKTGDVQFVCNDGLINTVLYEYTDGEYLFNLSKIHPVHRQRKIENYPLIEKVFARRVMDLRSREAEHELHKDFRGTN